MFEYSKPYFSFSVNDLTRAKIFYTEVLGLKVTEENVPNCGPMLTLHISGNCEARIYSKADHIPATFTILNFPVKKIETAVKELKTKGIKFEQYKDTDSEGISQNKGPLISWFKDPAGNFISIIQEEQMEEKKDLVIKRILPIEKSDLFQFFIRPEYLEKWSAPKGMTLRIPQFEARTGGKYRFEHTNQDGVYICHGYFKDFIFDEKLVQVDTVKDPEGKYIFKDLNCITEFFDHPEGAQVMITQTGFLDQNSLNACEDGWNQSLDKLELLINRKVPFHKFSPSLDDKEGDLRERS